MAQHPFDLLEQASLVGGYAADLNKDVAIISMAISMKRVADGLEKLVELINAPDAYGLTGSAAVSHAISQGLRDAGRR